MNQRRRESRPVSGRTRMRIQDKKREASRLSNRNGDDRPGRSDDDVTATNSGLCKQWQRTVNTESSTWLATDGNDKSATLVHHRHLREK